MGADTPKYVQGNSTESARKSTVAKPINIKTGKIIVLLVVGVAARWHYVYFNRPRVSKQSKTEIELVKLIRYLLLECDYFDLHSSIFLAICGFSFKSSFSICAFIDRKFSWFSEDHRITVALITCRITQPQASLQTDYFKLRNDKTIIKCNFNRPRVSKQSKTEIELVKLIQYSFLECDYFNLHSSIFLAICASDSKFQPAESKISSFGGFIQT